MTNKDTGDFAAFNFDFSDHLKINRRIGVRYPTPSLTVTIRKTNLLSFGGEFTGKLTDISAKGALIFCAESLQENTKLALKIIFSDGTLFNLKGKVVREKSASLYGVKFDNYNKDLDDYLFHTFGEAITK
jgi:hypothetical protein